MFVTNPTTTAFPSVLRDRVQNDLTDLHIMKKELRREYDRIEAEAQKVGASLRRSLSEIQSLEAQRSAALQALEAAESKLQSAKNKVDRSGTERKLQLQMERLEGLKKREEALDRDMGRTTAALMQEEQEVGRAWTRLHPLKRLGIS